MYFTDQKKEIIFSNAYELINREDSDIECISLGIKAMITLSEMEFFPAKSYLESNF